MSQFWLVKIFSRCCWWLEIALLNIIIEQPSLCRRAWICVVRNWDPLPNPEPLDSIALIVILDHIDKIKLTRKDDKTVCTIFDSPTLQENSRSITMVSRFWLPSHIIPLFDSHFSLVYLRDKVRKIFHFSPPNFSFLAHKCFTMLNKLITKYDYYFAESWLWMRELSWSLTLQQIWWPATVCSREWRETQV